MPRLQASAPQLQLFLYGSDAQAGGHGDLKNISAVGRVRGKILTKTSDEDEFKADSSGFRGEDDFGCS
jgi:hypothetical protein